MLAFDLKVCFSVLQFETSLDIPVTLGVFRTCIHQYSLRFCQTLFFSANQTKPNQIWFASSQL